MILVVLTLIVKNSKFRYKFTSKSFTVFCTAIVSRNQQQLRLDLIAVQMDPNSTNTALTSSGFEQQTQPSPPCNRIDAQQQQQPQLNSTTTPLVSFPYYHTTSPLRSYSLPPSTFSQSCCSFNTTPRHREAHLALQQQPRSTASLATFVEIPLAETPRQFWTKSARSKCNQRLLPPFYRLDFTTIETKRSGDGEGGVENSTTDHITDKNL